MQILNGLTPKGWNDYPTPYFLQLNPSPEGVTQL